MNKLRIRGLGQVILLDDPPELEREYLLSVRIERSGMQVDEREKDNPVNVYVCDYLATEQLVEIGSSKKIGVEKGKTQSQKLRWACIDVANARGIDPDNYYKQEMSRYIEEQKLKLE